MDFLNHLLDSSQVPVFTAFLLGLLTALSPCPLATNVTADLWLALQELTLTAENNAARMMIDNGLI
jgi:cytochrome c-type biogenesis protein